MKVMTGDDMVALGEQLGRKLRGGEVVELTGDVGAGKTTLTHGLALGLGVTGPVQSPSFTISCRYPARDGLTLTHYDFYRLVDAGIMQMELAETMRDPQNITVIEWGESVQNILPSKHIKVAISYLPGDGRDVVVTGL